MTTRTPRLVPASSSPARRRLLRDAGFAPAVDVSGVDESFEPAPDTASAVWVLAERKTSAVAGRHQGALVLGCDSLLDLDGAALGKPASRLSLHRDFADQVRKIKQWPAGAPGGRITFRHAIELEYAAPGDQ